MELDLRQLMRIAHRWWWLLLIAPVIAASVAFFVSNRETPQYSASVVLRVSPPIGSGIDQSAFNVSQNLGETYRQLITYTPVLQRVVDNLSLPYDTNALRAKVAASAIPDTQLIKVSVSDPDPDQAAAIANTIASEFTAYQAEDTTRQIQTQLTDIYGTIADTTQAELAKVQTELAALADPVNAATPVDQNRVNDLRIQEVQLQARLDSQQTQANSIASGVSANQVQVSVSNPAQAPSAPYAPRTAFYTVLGAFVGILIVVAAIALLEHLDNSVNGDTDFAALTGSTLLTTIPTLAKLKPGSSQVFSISQPRSSAAESIRLLRTNLEFAAAVAPIKTLAITSTAPAEGKSTITANLGVVMAQAGFRTVVIDADLRRPTQHKIFGVPNDKGLSRLLSHPETKWQDEAHRVALPGLVLLTSGPIPPNPSDLLAVDALDNLLEQISLDADIILIDTSPILAVSDPLVVAKKTDGVLLLSRSGTTRRDAIKAGAAALEQGGIRLVGVVLNQRSEREGSGYYYAYNSTEPTTDQDVTPPSGSL